MDQTEASLLRPAHRQPAAQSEAVPEAGCAQAGLIDNSPRLLAQRLLLRSAFGNIAQRVGSEGEEPLQGRLSPSLVHQAEDAAAKRTGRPDGLKSPSGAIPGTDRLGGRRRAGSGQPTAFNAPAHVLGSGLHRTVGSERHLPHEARNFVSQRQGRLAPTRQLKDGVPVDNGGRLEHEDDAMGARARAPGAMGVQHRLDGADAPVPAGGTVQRLLDDQANVALEPPTDKTPEALRNEINANLTSVSGGTTDAAQHGVFNNAGVGEGAGTKINIAKEAPQSLPATVAGVGNQHALTKHAVANMMLPRDDSHKIPMPEVSAALAVKDSGDPRWSGLNYQGKNLFLTLEPGGAVVTTYRRPWSEVQAQAYDRFADPEKYAKIAEKEKAEKKLVKTAVTIRDNEQKDQKAAIDALVKKAKAEDKNLRAASGVNYFLLGPKLTDVEATNLELVKTELSKSLPKAPTKTQTGSKGRSGKK